MITGYHPEMGEQRPAGDIEAKLCHSGKHWYLTTPLMLRGRGIRHTGTLTLFVGDKLEKSDYSRYTG